MKQIAISEAFAGFDATDWLTSAPASSTRRSLWKVSDMQWDDDVTVEGLLENVELGAF